MEDLEHWVSSMEELMKPDSVYWCNGTSEEFQQCCEKMVKVGTLLCIPQRKNCYLARSDPDDVARVEDRTFICSEQESDAGPTNHWMHPEQMRETLQPLFRGCMTGRTMYVIPFCMGPLSSDLCQIGVELTDSLYVVISMHIMTRMGKEVWETLKSKKKRFIPCVHSVGMPLYPGVQDVPWPHHPTKYIVHFPESSEIWSFGSGYGGNALLGKKCLALRIASVLGRDEQWLAEHMLLLGLTSPEGKKYHVAGAFPSACGKTNFSMMVPPESFKDWKITTLGDDIAWLKIRRDPQTGKNRLYGMNPEKGYFGVAPGTNWETNPNCMASLQENVIFTNVALTDEGDVWWEGMTESPPDHLIDWQGKDWKPGCGRLAAHPNSRFTMPAINNPVLDSDWEHPWGVPLDAIILGGRRATTIPLVTELRDWNTGVYFGATLASETTSAIKGQQGIVRRDPFAMIAFIGYHVGDYFQHWLNMGELMKEDAPKMFLVNWFRRDENRRFIWPGFGENMRVLLWMIGRIEGNQNNRDGLESSIGIHPRYEDFQWDRLKFSKEDFHTLSFLEEKEWREEIHGHQEWMEKMGQKCPTVLQNKLFKFQETNNNQE